MTKDQNETTRITRALPFTIIENEFILRKMRDLNLGALRVYLALCAHTNQEAVCWPSRARLLEICGIRTSGLKNAIKELIAGGFIIRVPRFTDNGGQRSNSYTITTFFDQGGASGLAPSPANAGPGGGASPLAPEQTQEELDSGGTRESSGLSADDDGSKIIVSTMVETYHERCPSLTKVMELTPPRRAAALARFRDLGGMMSNWEAYCDQIEASDFLAGRKIDFVAGFDFITKKANYIKVMEGRYVNRGQKDQGKNTKAAYKAAVGQVPGR